MKTKLNSLVGSEFNLPKHIQDVDAIKVKHKNLERKLYKVECENEDLKQKIINLEDKMLEHNIVISEIEEDKWEDPEPHREKVNRELSRIVAGNTPAERLENANKLDIISTERLGRYNPARPRPISVRLVHKKYVDLVLNNKKRLGKGIFMEKTIQ